MHDLSILLLGAACASLGVIAAAVADRIRLIRYTRERTAREPQPSRDRKAPPALPDRGLSRSELAEAQGFLPSLSPMARDVVGALMSVGYKKPAATEAVMACSAADRVTLELWTAAALRRAGKSVAS